MSQKFHVIVVGAGSTGTATAHDLALRQNRVQKSNPQVNNNPDHRIR